MLIFWVSGLLRIRRVFLLEVVKEGIGEWQVCFLDLYPRSLALLFG